ncbi:MAG: hypothetical protein KZQ90_03835 [Candidatus Thiodiazotropha sp. (ex Codakia rugifera)]|nr:hypothetical protein [Candidatus Thiodiazotropha sp. (ex Codakia rugifera)]
MNIKDYLIFSTVVSLFFVTATTIHAKNCVKGKPCGKGCIALDKNCRINPNEIRNKKSTSNESGFINSSRKQSVLRKSKLRLPKVYTITALSVNAKSAPRSKEITAHYKKGQRVFVYETFQSWARLNNMQPEEWVEFKHVKLK